MSSSFKEFTPLEIQSVKELSFFPCFLSQNKCTGCTFYCFCSSHSLLLLHNTKNNLLQSVSQSLDKIFTSWRNIFSNSYKESFEFQFSLNRCWEEGRVVGGERSAYVTWVGDVRPSNALQDANEGVVYGRHVVTAASATHVSGSHVDEPTSFAEIIYSQ